MLFRLTTLLVTCISTFAVGAEDTGVTTTRELQTQTITEIIAADPNLSTFLTAINTAEVGDALATLSGTTLAPINEAFAAFDPAFLALLLTPGWRLHLVYLLDFHVTTAQAFSIALPDGFELTMLNGEPLTVSIDSVTNSISFVNAENEGASVVQADIIASNGLVHTVDAVLSPSYFYRSIIDLSRSTYSTVMNLALLSGLDGPIRDGIVTLFAPTNDAFNALPSSTISRLISATGNQELQTLLLYHAVNAVVPIFLLQDGIVVPSAQGTELFFGVSADGIVTVNDATVIDANILANNGITHGIDKVLEPPVPTPPTPTPPTPTPTPPTPTPPTPAPSTPTTPSPPTPTIPTEDTSTTEDPSIYDVVSATSDLSTLKEGLDAAGLAAALDSVTASLTLMAPNDSAFAALPAGLLDTLFTPAFKKHLEEILVYHISDDVFTSQGLFDDKTIPTFNGEVVIFTVRSGSGFFNEAGLVSVDIVASNGIIHKLNGVLLPSFASRTVIDLAATYSTLMTLVEVVDLTDMLNTEEYTLFAPTNAAFEKLPQEDINFLSSAEGKDDLTALLSYHVLDSVLTSEKFTDGMEVTPLLAGSTITIGVGTSDTLNNAATVINPDILAVNGVTHGIDTVLESSSLRNLPPADPSSATSSSMGVALLTLVAITWAIAF